MKMRIICLCCFLIGQFLASPVYAQNVGINNDGIAPHASAMLDVSSNNKGVLIPRMDSIARKNIATPAAGLMVYDNSYDRFYYFNGTSWTSIGGGGADNLGNHQANQNIKTQGHWISNDGGNEGILIDSAGQVGIGVTPKSPLHVGLFTSPTILQIENGSSTTPVSINNYFTYQSFTATQTSKLDHFDLLFASFNDTIYYSIHEGVGPGGELLYSGFYPGGSTGWTSFPCSNVILAEGQQYSFVFTAPSAASIYFNFSYAGGHTHLGGSFDYSFRVYSKAESNGFKVSDDGVVVNDYSLPLTDGMTNQVLATDGAGNVSWSNPTGDNLGNHSANQNILLNNSWLSNDGGNEGIQIDNNGNTTINLDTRLGHNHADIFTFSGWGMSNNGLGWMNDPTTNLFGPAAWLSGVGGIQLFTGGKPRVTVSNSGNLLVGQYADDWGDGVLGIGNGNGTSKWEISTEIIVPIPGSYYGYNGDLVFKSKIGPLYDSPLVEVMRLNYNGLVGMGRTAATNRLEVEGEASKTVAGSWVGNSDARLKKNITPLPADEMLEKLLSLQGVTYEWEDDVTGSQRPEGIHYGFVAQNIQEVFPTLVEEDNLGYLQTAYGTYDAMLVEAIRALNVRIEQLEGENKVLKDQNTKMLSQINEVLTLKKSIERIEAKMLEEGEGRISQSAEEE